MTKRRNPIYFVLLALAFFGACGTAYGQYVYTTIQSSSGLVWGYASIESYESYDYVGVQGYLYDPGNNLVNQNWDEGWYSATADLQAQVTVTGYYTAYGYGYGSYGNGDGWVLYGLRLRRDICADEWL